MTAMRIEKQNDAMPRQGRIRGAAAALAVIAGMLVAGCSGGPGGSAARAERHWSMLEAYCFDCHNSVEYTAGLALDSMSPEEIAEDAHVWEKVVRKLRSRLMPPPGARQPDDGELDDFVTFMEARLDSAHTDVEPGYIGLRRLNRTEYANAVKDLIALDVDPSELLPVDGSEAGFNTVANALQVSPVFIDQYLNAARALAARALGNPDARPGSVSYEIPTVGQESYIEGLPLGTRGGAAIRHYFPADGKYLLSIGDLVTGRFGINQEHVNTLIATIDGRKFFQLDIGGGEDLKQLDQRGQEAVDEINARLKNIPFEAKAGEHEVVVTFLHRSFAESDRQLHSLTPLSGQDAVLKIERVEILGPVETTGLSMTASRRAVFSCYPDEPAEAADCAREIVSRLARKAFRGFAVEADLDRLMQMYELGYENGGFEKGIEYALSGVLAHPKFLFRVEEPPADVGPGGVYRLSSQELAARLSLFLWSTIPDDDLLRVAADGGLEDPEVFEQQVKRMLADPRSESLASNFAYQWLALDKLDAVDPDPVLFADVRADLREDLVREITLFVDSIFREDRSVLDLLTASHTYLNESLARHYGINHVRGDRFRRVELDDPNRFGLLGKGAVLMASSYPNRTSPVLRGAWLLDHILGVPPADPPPDVEALVDSVPGKAASTVRERLEAHRASPSCGGCHNGMDPYGFALENFDAVGRWREKDRESGLPIDPTAVLAGGAYVDGPVALREVILERPEQFVQTFIEKLMIYGLGRPLTYKDMPTVRRIMRQAATEDYRFSAIVLGIADSEQFRLNRLPGQDGAPREVVAENRN